jgi:hypothetical protein
MKNFFIFFVFAALILIGAGCEKSGIDGQKETKESKTSKVSGVADVCNYFPKELIEEAIGKPIVKVEVSLSDEKNCFYYTLYTDDFDYSPYTGNQPGGTPIVVVYDDSDFAKDKISNEKTGSKYTKDPSISMDNYVVRDFGGTIWQVVLILGQDKYIRMHYVHSAITGPELVKIGAKFAEKIASGK